MKIHRLERSQHLPITIHNAWAFFSSPHNLAKITPDDMGFEIVNGADRAMYAGQIISYVVRPILSIPLRWVTEITHVEQESYFVDEQRSGPYTLWHHTHIFKETEHGVLCTDLLHYALPFGFLGRMAHGLYVHDRLVEIFDFRQRKLVEIFGE